MIDPKLQAGLALAATAIVGGIVAGVIALRNPDGVVTLEDGATCSMHVAVDWQGPVPAGAKCKTSEIVGPSESWKVLGLCPGQYALARICAASADSEVATGLPGGISVISDATDEAVPYESGPQLEVWDIRHPDASALFRCACSTGIDCEWLTGAPGEAESWRPAPKSLTLYPGRFRGTGCRAKQCTESWTRRYPGESMPEACRAAE